MDDVILRQTLKEDLVILGIKNYRNITGFKTIFGRDRKDLTVDEIVDVLSIVELRHLDRIIRKTFDYDSGRGTSSELL